MINELWTEKYRPKNIESYVWRDDNMKLKVLEWISDGAIPHLILSGKSGLGKTSLAKMMLHLLGVPKSDILEINASKSRKIDDLQDRISRFASTYCMIDNLHEIKYVLLEEADSMSLLAQKFLRAELETNVNHVRFIFSCNYIEKIEPAIIGRCQHYHFTQIDQDEFVIRLSDILDTEQITYDLDNLVEYINCCYPDLRKCINMLQQNTINKILVPMSGNEQIGFDYVLEIFNLFKNGNHKSAREVIVKNATQEEYTDIFRFCYQNLELWGNTQDEQDDALIIIRDGIYRDQIVADREINLAATLCELSRNGKK